MEQPSSKVGIKGFRQNGDCSILIDFAASTELAMLAHIHTFADKLRQTPLPDQINAVPAKTTLMLAFSSPVQAWEQLHQSLREINTTLQPQSRPQKTHLIPVCYHPEIAPDLETVLLASELRLEALIRIHSGRDYLLSMLGFLPGFMYLDALDQRLVLPRKTTPAVRLPAGSVAIAGNQCGLYSISSPGGWHVIGRTPVRLLDWSDKQPIKIQAMDKISFQPISLEEFNHYENAGGS